MYLHNYGLSSGNKYKMKRLVREYLSSLKDKYIPKNITKFFDIRFYLDNHFSERMLERRINKVAFERVITHLVKYRLCEVIYASTVNPAIRINIKDYTGLVVGVTGKHHENGVFNIKLHTCFTNRDYKGSMVKTYQIDIKEEIRYERRAEL